MTKLQVALLPTTQSESAVGHPSRVIRNFPDEELLLLRGRFRDRTELCPLIRVEMRVERSWHVMGVEVFRMFGN